MCSAHRAQLESALRELRPAGLAAAAAPTAIRIAAMNSALCAFQIALHSCWTCPACNSNEPADLPLLAAMADALDA